MQVTATGATGLIGSALVRELTRRGDRVTALTRDPNRSASTLDDEVLVRAWPDPQAAPPPAESLERADAVVHLLGEPVAQRWTGQAKAAIRDSRILSTRSLVAGLRALTPERRPRTLVSQSATGYYGPRSDEPVDERASPGQDFLAQVTIDWEHEASAAEPGTRVTLTRTGVVLSHRGGALAKMLPPFRLGVGGPVAGGRQYVPWIHLDDVVRGLVFCLDNPRARGPVNLTASRPVTNAELSKALGRVLHRPAVLPVPAAALRLLYGEMASIVVTGQRAIPARLQELGFEFEHPELDPALQDILGRG